MRVLISSLLFWIAFFDFSLANGQLVWNFGDDTPDSYVVGHEIGEVQLLEKIKQIPLKVPQCHQVTSVQVEVLNRVSEPTVTYDETSYMVTIGYSLQQISRSKYDILVKGRPIPQCAPDDFRNLIGCKGPGGKPVPCESYNDYY